MTPRLLRPCICALLFFATQASAQLTQTAPTVAGNRASFKQGQQSCPVFRVSYAGAGSSGAGTITVRKSADAVVDTDDPVIATIPISAPGLGPGGFFDIFACNKFCELLDPFTLFFIGVITQTTAGNAESVSETASACLGSTDEGTVPEDDKQSRDAGDPINTFTGGLHQHFPPDLYLGGPLPLYFARYYVSDYIRTTRPASFMGTNWRHNFDWILEEDGATTRIVTDSEGRRITFTTNDGGSTWTLSDPLDIPYQLVNGAAGEYLLGHPTTHFIYTFTVAPGQFLQQPRGLLTQVSDGHGNTHTLTYDDEQLIQVADGLGRTLTFAYDSATLLDSVTDDQGRSVSFTHGGKNLRELLTSKDALLQTTTYSYDAANTFPGMLTGYTRPGGNTPRTQTFDANSGKVLTQTAVGNTSSLAYAANKTTFTDPDGNTQEHTYSATGEVTAVKNQTGNNVTRAIDASSKRLASVTDTLGATTAFSYHAPSGKPSQVTHGNGQVTVRTYAARAAGNVTQHDLASVTYNDGTTEVLTYDASGNLLTYKDRAANVTTYTYNARGQVLTVTDPEGGVVTMTYNADGTLATAKDPFNNTTTYGYDANRRVNLITYADASTRSFSYDANDRLLTTTDPRGNTTTYTYDSNDNVATVTDRAGNVTTYSHDDLDRVATVQDTSVVGKPQAFVLYDKLERLERVIDRNGNTTKYRYDGQGRLTRVIDPLNNNWDNAYTDEGILSSSKTPLNHTFNWTSDAMGRITQETTALGNVSSVVHDAMGRVASRTDPLNKTTSFTYDARGLLSAWSLPGNISASYTRNKLGQITRVTDPRGSFWERSYVKGRMSGREDPLGNTFTYSYDNRSRLDVLTLPGALGTLGFTYDNNGNVTRRLYSGGGPDLQYTYDAMDRLLTGNGIALTRDTLGRITRSNGIDIAYDPEGRFQSVDLDTAGNTRTVQYGYDANGRIGTVSDWVGGITTLDYDAAGRLTTITRPNGVVTTYSYDNDGALVNISDAKNATVLQSHAITRDAASQPTTALRNVPIAPSPPFGTENWSVDDAGQIDSFDYDELGRLTDNNEGTTRTWDLASRMTASNDGTASTYAYDALGQRTMKTVGADPARGYVWNLALGLSSVAIETSGGSDLRYYIHTPDGMLLHSIDASGNARHFYHFDELGNTMLVTDDSGAMEAAYFHDPYGRLLAETGTLDNPFTWQGQWGVMDDGNGQYYVRARYYDAITQRFISRDPVASIDPRKIDPYQYAVGNPLIYNDPSGLDASESLAIKRALDSAIRRAGRISDADFELALRRVEQVGLEGSSNKKAKTLLLDAALRGDKDAFASLTDKGKTLVSKARNKNLADFFFGGAHPSATRSGHVADEVAASTGATENESGATTETVEKEEPFDFGDKYFPKVTGDTSIAHAIFLLTGHYHAALDEFRGSPSDSPRDRLPIFNSPFGEQYNTQGYRPEMPAAASPLFTILFAGFASLGLGLALTARRLYLKAQRPDTAGP